MSFGAVARRTVTSEAAAIISDAASAARKGVRCNDRQSEPEEVRVTVRGPVTYAGPGSLGGTKSALRR